MCSVSSICVSRATTIRVPRALFWLFHLLWLFPWSAFLAGTLRRLYRPRDRAGQGPPARPSAGAVSCCCSSASRRRRNTTRCHAIRRWRCCWRAGWLAAAEPSRSAPSCSRCVAADRRSPAAAIFVERAQRPYPGRYLRRAFPESELYTLSLGHMADLTLGILRLSSGTRSDGGARVSDRRHRRLDTSRNAPRVWPSL